MSLVALAIRKTICRALLGRTYAESNVFDSEIAPIDSFLSGKPMPVIIVSTEDETAEMSGHDYIGLDREMTVVVEVAVASALQDRSGYRIAHSDEGLEQIINYTIRQVLRVLQVDESGPWSNLYRSFSNNPTKYVTRRGASAEEGIKFAARQVIITCEPLAEPLFGATVPETGPAWIDLMQALRDDGQDELADSISVEITGAAIPSWAQLQATMGYTRGGMAAVGLGPLLPGEAPAEFVKGTSTGDHLEMEEEGEGA